MASKKKGEMGMVSCEGLRGPLHRGLGFSQSQLLPVSEAMRIAMSFQGVLGLSLYHGILYLHKCRLVKKKKLFMLLKIIIINNQTKLVKGEFI